MNAKRFELLLCYAPVAHKAAYNAHSTLCCSACWSRCWSTVSHSFDYKFTEFHQLNTADLTVTMASQAANYDGV